MMDRVQPGDRIQDGQSEVARRALTDNRACCQDIGAPGRSAFTEAVLFTTARVEDIPRPGDGSWLTAAASADLGIVYIVDRAMVDRALNRSLMTQMNNNGMVRNRKGVGQ